jgi:protease-4
MERRHPIQRGLAVIGGIVLGVLVLALGVALVSGDLADTLVIGNTVGVVELRGVIREASEPIEALERFRKNDAVVAVVVRVESPGGAVAPSQEIYEQVWRVRETKPVIASLGNVAASGGYYVASAANVIVADPGTITGSIGAIMEVPYMAPLAEKLGVSQEIVKSGQFKDTGHPLRTLSDDERALLQGMVDEVLKQFVEAVARGRSMAPERVRALADGRIFSGTQAAAAGLVDQLGGLDAATRVAWTQAGQTGDPHVTRVKTRRIPWWLELVRGGARLPDALDLRGGLLLLYRGPGPQ